MVSHFPASTFSKRDFYLPHCRWNFEPLYRNDIQSARDDAEVIGLLTQVLSILCYLDVPDSEMQNRCLGSFDGSWTQETQQIASMFALPIEQIIKTKYYRDLGPAWLCPGCSRSKIETARPLPHRSKTTFRFVAHHDHMFDDIGAF
ncbi:hypothetical protein E0H70_35860 [Rhizobium leguminosarum bv. viciae]|nr:hypothetical protein E0H70_35860 [Rhizobium leguminosarum bv. viciae]